MKTKFWNGSFLRTVLQCLAMPAQRFWPCLRWGRDSCSAVWSIKSRSRRRPAASALRRFFSEAFWLRSIRPGSGCLLHLRLRAAALRSAFWRG